jgi:hypothetical protein
VAKKRRAFDKVEEALRAAKAQGIRIVRVPMFDWTDLGEDRSKPRACDATGAVLIQMGYGKAVFDGKEYGSGVVRPKGWVVEMQNYLGVGVYWLYSFWLGWDQGRQIQIAETNDNGDIVGWKDEPVSKETIKLAKRWVR